MFFGESVAKGILGDEEDYMETEKSWGMKIRLGEIAKFSNGLNFNKAAYMPGVALISVSDFGNRFSPDYAELNEVNAEIVRENDCLEDGDIVFVRSNGNKELVGRCMLIKNPPFSVTYSGFCIRARLNDTKIFDPTYFAYHFKSSVFRKAMSGNAVGTNIQNLSQGRLANYIINVPDIDTQHHIADMLTVYDDLIENNRRQIKLLEEAAQRLYKEWFVELHFPGHENAKIVNGLPEGWSKVSLADIAPIMTGKKDANFGTVNGQYPFFTCAQEPIRASAYSFDCNAVILAGNGDFNVKLFRGKFEAYQRTYVLKPYESCNLFPLFYAVQDNMRQLFQGSSGSTIKFLTKGMIEAIKVYVPTAEIRDKFNFACENYQQKIMISKTQIKSLTEVRDRLLPRLMSGDMEAKNGLL